MDWISLTFKLCPSPQCQTYPVFHQLNKLMLKSIHDKLWFINSLDTISIISFCTMSCHSLHHTMCTSTAIPTHALLLLRLWILYWILVLQTINLSLPYQLYHCLLWFHQMKVTHTPSHTILSNMIKILTWLYLLWVNYTVQSWFKERNLYNHIKCYICYFNMRQSRW